MRWLALVALWGLSAALGIHLAQQESFSATQWLLIVGWLGLAFAVGAGFLRLGKRGGDGAG